MKLVVSSLLAAILSTISLSSAGAEKSLGEMVRPPSDFNVLMLLPSRTIMITPGTKYINVNHGEIVRFISKGREFSWYFDGTPGAAPFDITEIAPGFPASGVTVYVGTGDRSALP